jgi:hypothetical protein
MKRLSTYTIVLFAFVLISCNQKPEDFLVGTWKGNGLDQSIVFRKDQTASLHVLFHDMGGDNFSFNGVKALLKYSYNNIESPMWLDFSIVDAANGKELSVIKGIVKMDNSDRMRLRLNFKGKRFVFFTVGSSDSTSVILQRVR